VTAPTTDVVVTGYGATTPLGGDAASTWEALLAGKSGVRTSTGEFAERFDLPVKISAQLAAEPTDTIEMLVTATTRRLATSTGIDSGSSTFSIRTRGL